MFDSILYIPVFSPQIRMYWPDQIVIIWTFCILKLQIKRVPWIT